ncbi:hypothetical protein RF11_03559 [Thelohanellus kitauei]|uniref:Uncharacterized protein n=1 Tax=Thelohanellus kitauei TaxID=669202 RepID=A0A0C2MPV2_THEKT|nr:hypothetical protein RF11_03559 [Thelohanellus kitauei]
MLKYITENHSSVVKIPSKSGINNIIKRVRGMTNIDISAIETEPHSKTSSRMRFLRRTGFGDIDGITYRYASWASNDGLSILRMESQIFIDATFKCLIIMSYDPSSRIYVPCV